MIATAKMNMVITNNNGRTKKGYKLKKDRKIKKGEKLKVIEIYRVSNAVYEGEVVVLEKNNVYLTEEKNKFNFEGNKTQKEKIEGEIKPLLEKYEKINEEILNLSDEGYSIIKKGIDENRELTEKENKHLEKINKKRHRLSEKNDKIWNDIKSKKEEIK